MLISYAKLISRGMGCPLCGEREIVLLIVAGCRQDGLQARGSELLDGERGRYKECILSVFGASVQAMLFYQQNSAGTFPSAVTQVRGGVMGLGLGAYPLLALVLPPPPSQGGGRVNACFFCERWVLVYLKLA